ncbi:MAG: hypothetical protein P4K92_00455 [Candidatus Nitrosotalea sp.]|nr:hypothetical protein [Candidatus Nitrosotalea sp.]
MKINSNPLFLLTKLSRNTRIFIAISSIACYGLFLYELLPEYLFNTSFSLYYFVLPVVAISAILVVLPKIMTKGTPKQIIQNPNQINSVLEQDAPDMTSFKAPKQEIGIISNNENEGGIISDIILPTPGQESTTNLNPTPSSVVVHQPVVDENLLGDLVAKAVDPFQRELARMQDIVSDVRSEINSVKSTISELTLTFETSLTDLKAFQAEIANPLNFMRKYFDSIDIKNLSDPTLPLYAEQSPMQNGRNSNVEISNPKKESDIESDNLQSNHIHSSNEEIPKITMPKQGEEERHEPELQETLPFKQLFSGSLTLGKLMNTTSVLEEILQTVDRDSIDMLIEQCKLMGLRQEDEHVIYNIINMMDQSGLSVREILIMLYKFGKVMGISDKEADLVYAKLMMSQGKTPSPLVTVESKGN